MKFVLNRYSVDLHIVLEDPPPIEGIQIEHLPFGVPPFEIRPIWTVFVYDLTDVMNIVEKLNISVEVSKSGFWSGTDLGSPGARLYGLSLIDDPAHTMDPLDLPIAIRPRE